MEYTHPATEDDVAMRLASLNGPVRLYRASLEWFDAHYRGETFWFPPDLGGQTVRHPETKKDVAADGIYVVKPRMEMRFQEQPSTVGTKSIPIGVGIGAGFQVSEIAAFMLRKYGEIGVVILDGQSDASAKAWSTERVYESVKVWADRERSSRLLELEKWKKGNPGVEPPPPTKEQQRAQEWLDAQAVKKIAKYRCPEGCLQSDDAGVFERHMLVAHRQTVKAEDPSAALTEREKQLAAREAALAAREAELDAITKPPSPKGGSRPSP